jgi:pyridoxal phosphate enzyme (YggS family)
MAAACTRAGRALDEVTLVAVTKGQSAATIESALLAHGHRELGENRVQEWLEKADALSAYAPHWHHIGHLQTNKVRYCRPFALLHGVDSLRLLEALEADGAKHAHTFRVLLQLNLSGEATKHGLPETALAETLARARDLPHVQVEGLMTMAPYDPNPERARPLFARLHALAERHTGGRASMGMSGDFEVAIEEGATWVRVGSALFAP